MKSYAILNICVISSMPLYIHRNISHAITLWSVFRKKETNFFFAHICVCVLEKHKNRKLCAWNEKKAYLFFWCALAIAKLLRRSRFAKEIARNVALYDYLVKFVAVMMLYTLVQHSENPLNLAVDQLGFVLIIASLLLKTNGYCHW